MVVACQCKRITSMLQICGASCYVLFQLPALRLGVQ